MDRAKATPTERSKPGSDFLQLASADAPPGQLSAWLAEQVRAAISAGRLPVGSRLPASRTLAAELQVSRGVVTEAYQRLVADGYAAGHGRAGTVVVAAPTVTAASAARRPSPVAAAPAAQNGPARLLSPAALFDAPGRRGDLFEALRAAPARVDLTPGLPDLAAFPRAAWLRAERAVLGELAWSTFGYGDPRGAPSFRAAVATWLARTRAITVDPDDVIIVSGVAQSLALLARVLRAHGIDEIAVEDPGSLGARQQLQAWQVRTPPVAVDAEGLRVAELAASSARVVLVTPAHQFPTGVVLSPGRRRELMAWAGAGGLIIEDDYDAEHRYDRPPVAALRSVLPESTCYTGSVSKLLAPALRVGWLIVPSAWRDELIAAKRHTDLGNAVLAQLVLAELMRTGALERHLRLTGRRHRARRDAMITAIAAALPTARVQGSAAGLHLTITFPDGPADSELAARCLAAGVKVQPLSWHRQGDGPAGLVLGYAATAAGDIAEGIATIGRVLAR